ncbi:hypothetical protein ABEV34_23290 [Methylorubrum rhodesianum]|uniref:hypothetical protein n=1 Tax=Methylorubrum rhodesianum TaxID=29427 RepID=UPI0016191368|nr:hypothetical protein [Methylorubrum rhodesianum]MBB5762418.1 hypothetical protein [Methylorubrum rhodesianum]
MTARSASSYDEAVCLGRLDPAASAYGAHRRDPGAIRREVDRVRALMKDCGLPAATPVLVTTPADDVAADAAEVRRAVMSRFRL